MRVVQVVCLDTLYILLELGGMIIHDGYTDTTAVQFFLTLHKAIEGDFLCSMVALKWKVSDPLNILPSCNS